MPCRRFRSAAPRFTGLLVLVTAVMATGCKDETRRVLVAGDAIGDTTGYVWTPPPHTPTYGETLARLVEAKGCGEVMDTVRNRIVTTMAAEVEAQKQRALKQVELGCGSRLTADGGGPAVDAQAGETMVGTGDTLDTPESDTKDAPSNGGQPAGVAPPQVEEADFLKYDDKYLYLLADKKLRIFDVSSPADIQEVGSHAFDGIPRRLFVHGDYAVVFESKYPLQLLSPNAGMDAGGGWQAGTDACTYGYDCDFTGDAYSLDITVLDITNRKAPVPVRKAGITGTFLSARLIGNVVHTVVVFPQLAADKYDMRPKQLLPWEEACSSSGAVYPYSAPQVAEAYELLKAKNEKVIEQLDLTGLFPSVIDQRDLLGKPTTDTELFGNCGGFLMGQEGDGQNLIGLISFDLTSDEPLSARTVLGRPGAVYATAKSIYIAQRHYRQPNENWYWQEDPSEQATSVHRFSLPATGVTTTYMGSGVVKGLVLNEFSMNESGDDLRLATTLGKMPNPAVENHLYVMEQAGLDRLETVGALTGLVKGQDIRSVRFDDKTAYLSTADNTAPLLVIDLTDKTHPKEIGQLKVPGFATYMQFIAPRTLLTLGFEVSGASAGRVSWSSLRLQLVDVAVPASPKLLHAEVIGTQGSSSAAATDHLAFNWDGNRHWLGLPATVCGAATPGIPAQPLEFSGLYVYDVTAFNGFQKLGGLPLVTPNDEVYAKGCADPWMFSTSEVKRSLFIGDYVFAISARAIVSAKMGALETPLDTQSL
ncbi:MAG: beta-propeller domain-containing protein [Myxococcota bacterium]